MPRIIVDRDKGLNISDNLNYIVCFFFFFYFFPSKLIFSTINKSICSTGQPNSYDCHYLCNQNLILVLLWRMKGPCMKDERLSFWDKKEGKNLRITNSREYTQCLFPQVSWSKVVLWSHLSGPPGGSGYVCILLNKIVRGRIWASDLCLSLCLASLHYFCRVIVCVLVCQRIQRL